MSVAKSLSQDQIAEIQAWADDGAALADIQKRLDAEMDVSVTYMEMRFLIEDLGITLKPDEPKKEETASEPEGDDELISDAAEDSDGVKITVDAVQRPGMIVSGKVTFSGGKQLSWYLDQLGRMGMDPDETDPDYRPSESQLRAFQTELQKVLREKGFG